MHGFPYDVHAYAGVAPLLAAEGCRVVVPYLRGFGPTQFVDAATPRSGEQAALASDVLALLNALGIPRAVLAGYDWGGTAACAAAALWPERCAGLLSFNSYKVQNIAAAQTPAAPEDEFRYWYQWYFQGERGRAGLAANRRALCKLLWRLWSPSWRFDEATWEASAPAFDNPDFVDVCVHSYRHRFGLVDGDPAYDDTERRIAELPAITVPTIVLDGEHDTVSPVQSREDHEIHFTALVDHRVLDAGHALPQEAPAECARAVLDVRR